MGRKAKHPYKGYAFYTYRRSSDLRMAVVLVKGDDRRCLLLSRYRIEVSLGERLPSNVHVDHVDGNRLNDSLANLQVLSASENIRKSSPKKAWVELKCPICKIVFHRPYSNVRCKTLPVTCSRTCGRKKATLKLKPKSNILRKYLK